MSDWTTHAIPISNVLLAAITSNKQCLLAAIPLHICKQCFDVLEPITDLVNLSLSSGSTPSS